MAWVAVREWMKWVVWEWGEWEWWDRLATKCRQMGFRPAAFPHWHCPPPWYVREVGLEGIRCLEHDRSFPCLSVWDPVTLGWFERCIRAMADHCRQADTTPEGIYLGIHGDYGECMFFCGSTPDVSARTQVERGETVDHCHPGFWCGDRHAREHFRAHVMEKYGDLDGVNRAWASRLGPDDALDFPQRHVCSPRAWLDFAHWYRDGMTTFTANVAKLYRRYFPEAILFIPLGGGVEPLEFGQDSTGLPKAMVDSGTHVRSTAGGCCAFNPSYETVEKFTRVYPILKRISTACRFYGAPMWTEAPYPPSMGDVAITGRVFETLSCGAIGYYDWNQAYHRQWDRYHQTLGYIQGKTPLVDTAVFYPASAHFLAKTRQHMPPRFWEGSSRLRAVCDYDVVDERLVADGALAGYRCLIVFEADVMEAQTADEIRRWVDAGGHLVLAGSEEMLTVEGDAIDFPHPAGTGEVHVFDAGFDDVAGLLVLCRQVRLQAVGPVPALEITGRKDQGDAIFWTRFADGCALLNLNDQPAAIRLEGKDLTVPAYDLTWIDLP